MGERPHTCRRRQALLKLEDRWGRAIGGCDGSDRGRVLKSPHGAFCHNPTACHLQKRRSFGSHLN